MKKILILAVSVIMLLGVTGCGEKEPSSQSGNESTVHPPLYEQGLHAVNLVDEKVHSPEYVAAMTNSTDITDSDIFHTLESGDYSTPDKIYQIVFPEDIIDLFAGLNSETIDVSQMSADMKSALSDQLFTSYPTLITSRQTGVIGVAVTSIFSGKYLFVDDTAPRQNLMCLYCYENSYPIVVIFTYGADGAIEANGSFLIIDDFQSASEETVKYSIVGMFRMLGLDFDVEVTQVL